jgi:AcrR family transcriptional regulator
MQKVGLTHGGFYGHFASKDDLSAEITARALGKNAWPKTVRAGNVKPSFSEAVRAYLSPRHRDDPGHGCLLAAVGSAVGRQTHNIRRAFTEGFRARVEMLRTLAPGRSAAARRRRRWRQWPDSSERSFYRARSTIQRCRRKSWMRWRQRWLGGADNGSKAACAILIKRRQIDHSALHRRVADMDLLP